jgi:hypothetical protein
MMSIRLANRVAFQSSTTGLNGGIFRQVNFFKQSSSVRYCSQQLPGGVPKNSNDSNLSNSPLLSTKQPENVHSYLLPHPYWTRKDVDDVKITHKSPSSLPDRIAYIHVFLLRTCFDIFTGYKSTNMSEKHWMRRIIFLETLAGVPGMMGAMARHLQSLRRLKRDHGWIHTLLEEAENERMHLLVALELRKPSLGLRLMVLLAQGVFVNFFFLAYLVSPRYCHNFVGYLEEEAVKTYSKLLDSIDHGSMQHWKTTPAPSLAKSYWKLPEEATLNDVFMAIRADEAHHRDVNQILCDLSPGSQNPFGPGE